MSMYILYIYIFMQNYFCISLYHLSRSPCYTRHPLAAYNLNAPSGYIAITSIVELHIVLEIVLSRLSKIWAWIKAYIFCINLGGLGDAHPSFSNAKCKNKDTHTISTYTNIRVCIYIYIYIHLYIYIYMYY